MDRPNVEMLAASLVREYLARKKLVLSLSQLDEEQPRQCVRSRLELLKALHIGKLVKRNKLSASPLDSMLELIVHFLLCHVRPSRAATAHGPRLEDLGRGGGTTPPEKVLGVDGNSPALSRPVEESGQVGASADGEIFCPRVVGSLRDSHDPGRMPSRTGLGEGESSTLKADKGSETPGTNFAINDVLTQRRNSIGSRKHIEDLEQSVSVSDVSVRNVDIHSNKDSNATESDTYDSDDSESESASSFASIVDLLKDGSTEPKGALRDSRRAVELTLKVPNVALVASTSSGAGDEDDLEVIDAGADDGAQEERGIAAIGKKEHQRASTWTHQGEEEEEGVSKDEVVSAKPSRVGMVSPPRPGTQDSAQTPAHLLWLQADDGSADGGKFRNGHGGGGSSDGGEGRSPDLMKLNTFAPNFNMTRTYDEALDTFRPQGNLEIQNNHHMNHHSNGHIPNGMFSGAFNGYSLADNTVPNGSLQLSIQGKSVFDTDADDDIVQMAAQRDQLRGARNIRGMMAPVMSKEEDPRNRSANRRFLLTKQRSESMLGDHEESQEDMFPSMDNREDGDEGDVVGTMNRRRGIRELGGLIGGLGGVGLRPSADYLSDLNRRGDIMAQSMRRQSLKGSKQNLLEGGLANFGSNDSSRMSIGTVSPEEFLIFKSENDKSAMIEQGTGAGSRKGQPRFIPNSHEDIQILNLQGFMDASSFANDLGNLSKRKQRKKRGKRGLESGQIEKIRDGYKQSSRPRRKRSHRLPKTHLSDDDDGELTLKDIDDLDNKVAGLVIGPKTVNTEAAGTPITLEEASHLRNLLTGSPANTIPAEWMQQNFKQNANPNLSYGLVQNKGGPCGVLACVQAYMMKCLIFGTPVSPSTSPVSPLRPSQREWLWALGSAITEILWKAGEEKKAILALPGSFAHFAEHGVGRYSNDGVTENLNLHEFVVQGDLYDAVNRHMSVFTAETGSGCVILLYSLLLTRGLENVETDKDAGGGHLLNAHGYSSQEIVNLLLTGIASTNTFNGDQTLGGNSEDKVVLKGVHHRSDIGLLSLFEHYDCYKVGSHLKTPQYPIWVVCCESHYSVLFSRDTAVSADVPPNTTRFDIYYYDGLALQEDEIRLTIDMEGRRK
ncbi:uncharacterized protein LOC125035250 [Penaeus chinensis]|uniref:uncharacterized protein LOC125035250 n=1 Tax=Penaeus chinensis TaxID=139456 RepID=UPI001FB5FDB4|nr:uncharacterized protein LOC125035250 [Penaeus chinensis]XP_047483474.1 uncharacterized protein LOC125035250 [Penaeus chinensis]